MSMKIQPPVTPSLQSSAPARSSEPVKTPVTPPVGTPTLRAQQADRFDTPDPLRQMQQQMEQVRQQQQLRMQQQLILQQLQNPGARPAPVTLPPVNQVRPSYDTARLQGAALAAQLEPTGSVRELFRNTTDVSGVASAPAPEGRFETGYAEGDLIFQQTTRGLIDRGVINDRSFVLMDTGHVIPQADELLRASGLRAQGSFALPPIAEDANNQRVSAQTQTWGDRMQQLQQQNATQRPGALYLGIDVHRQQSLSTQGWPTAEQLKARGITNVPVLVESTPSQEYSLENVRDDVRPYLEGLKAAGLQVTVHGVDGRY